MIGFDDMDMIVEILENRPSIIAEVSPPLGSARRPSVDVDKLGRSLKGPPDRHSATIDGHGAFGTFDHNSYNFSQRICSFSQVPGLVFHSPTRKDGWRNLPDTTWSNRCFQDQQFRNSILFPCFTSSFLAVSPGRTAACVQFISRSGKYTLSIR
jgi:hypothetical protein